MCHGFVKFVLARDAEARFRFSPLERLPESRLAGLPNSVVVRSGDTWLVKSDAALFVLAGLGRGWRALAGVCKVFPLPLRDWVYGWVARLRYRIFGRRVDACPLIPKELESRFDL